MVNRNVYVLFSSLLFSSFFLILITTSCQREDDPVPVSFTPDTEQEGMMKLGKKLENPYTVENMRKAYQNLVNRGMLKSGIEIDATHLYIRYLPEDDQELDDFENTLLSYLSEDDLELMEEEYAGHFFDYPLEYEIEEGGTYYYDPELPPGGITWQYTVVPVSYDMPVVNYEVIDPLYLDGAEFEVAYSAGGGMEADVWDLLETEALILAGDPDAEIVFQTGLKSTNWRPSGTITVWDDTLKLQIPLQGVKVRARRWFTVYTGITDATGKFSVSGTFKRPANYSIIWERADWDIRSGMFIQAYYNGPKRQYSWILPIGSESNTNKSMRYATMHRAAFRYFYGNNLGMFRPKLIFGSKTKICYRDGIGTAVFWGDWSAGGIVPDIQVWGKNSHGNYYTTDTIFAHTIHELAHQAHSQILGNIQYYQVSKIIYESWAESVEWALTSLEYHELGFFTYIHNDKQDWSIFDSKDYTPLFIDLVDDINQKALYGGLKPNDNVSGYTMQSLNSMLMSVYGLTSLKSALKSNKPIGVTDAQIDELFFTFENL